MPVDKLTEHMRHLAVICVYVLRKRLWNRDVKPGFISSVSKFLYYSDWNCLVGSNNGFLRRHKLVIDAMTFDWIN